MTRAAGPLGPCLPAQRPCIYLCLQNQSIARTPCESAPAFRTRVGYSLLPIMHAWPARRFKGVLLHLLVMSAAVLHSARLPLPAAAAEHLCLAAPQA